MVYWTSLDPTLFAVSGNQVSDFKLTLDGFSATWYYLDIRYIKPVQPAGLYPFYLTRPFDSNTAFWGYWAARGVTGSATGWQGVMWQIITGAEPMFRLSTDGERNYKLVDGLQYNTGQGEQPLRLNGDYPKGSYTFTCDAAPLLGTTMKITFR